MYVSNIVSRWRMYTSNIIGTTRLSYTAFTFSCFATLRRQFGTLHVLVVDRFLVEEDRSSTFSMELHFVRSYR